ncbi:MAG: DUF2911 domain-containing protein [Gemmatimonas sp.]|nr:DUF2911 domain-containing protein [Gemmatimonas sp.]
MKLRITGVAVFLGIVAGCAAEEAEPVAEAPMEAEALMPQIALDADAVELACEPQGMPLEDRVSPYDSVSVSVGGQQAKLCYGRPSMRDREIFGSDLVPFDTIWRTGANEPTTIHIPFPVQIAGLAVEPGSYSIYTVPGEDEWEVIVNRSTSQWGIETEYTEEVRAQEVGRATVPLEANPEAVETFTITTEEMGEGAVDLVLEWENSRVRIPVEQV